MKGKFCLVPWNLKTDILSEQPGTSQSVHAENNSSAPPVWKPFILYLLGYISDFLSTRRVKVDKTLALLIITEGIPHSPLLIKQPMSIKHYQQLPGHWRAEAKGWLTVVSTHIRSQSTQGLATRDPPLTSTRAKVMKYARCGETRSS